MKSHVALWAGLVVGCDTATPTGDEPVQGDGVAIGDVAVAGAVAVELRDAVPLPVGLGQNLWTVAATVDGAPATDAQVVLEPWMPDHGHGTTPRYAAGVEQEPGVYAFGPFTPSMPGTWEIRVGVVRGAVDEVATFTVDVAG